MEPRSISPGSTQGWPKSLHLDRAPGGVSDSLRRSRHLCDASSMGLSEALARVVLSVLALSGAACLTPDAQRTQEPPRAPSVSAERLAAVPAPPEWRPGDRWTYDVMSGKERGTKTMEVVEVRELSNVPYYVVRLGDLDHYYTRSLNWAAEIGRASCGERG